MTDRPIIFSAPMVRALIEARKTQTRRVLNLPTKNHNGGPIYERKDMGGWANTTLGGRGVFSIDKCGNRVPVPERPAIWHQTTGVTMALPYAPGDRLWVREAALFWKNTADNSLSHVAAFKADGYELEPGEKWRPSIHMPRRASRLTLTVTDVRVQRVQDITEADVLGEGCPLDQDYHGTTQDGSNTHMVRIAAGRWQSPRAWYHTLWNSLHGPDAWDANPFVAAITFTVDQRNIDAGRA